MTEHLFRSTILNNTRRVWVWTPPGAPADDLGAVVLLDGADWVETLGIATTLDNLLADSVIPPVVVALPESLSFATRTRELCCHRPFADFLADELCPWLTQGWGATTAAERCAVLGFSYGGLAATYAAVVRPDRFGTAVSQSGSFWWHPDPADEPPRSEWLLDRVRSSSVRGRFRLEVGSLEGHWMVPQTRRLGEALRDAGAEVAHREFAGGHDLNCWHAELPAALAWVTRDWPGRA